MLVIPAIDLKDGRCVRLRQGRLDALTEFSDDPVGMARRWAREGASYLHVVDLDGAFTGRPVHLAVVAQIVRQTDISVEFGGGLRTEQSVREALGCGVDRVVLGTRVCQEPELMARLVRVFGPRIAVAIDAREGWIQVKGWTETTRLRSVEFARRADEAGVTTLIVTDTSMDGTLGGPNLRGIDEVCQAVKCRVIASGGIASVEHVRRLRALRRANLVGIIVGRALYDGTARLAELTAAASERNDGASGVDEC
ncbi:MAG: 1-(5-phosphoribosyl)-5-[(5-phosphoribosylamino)methylideneamino]imidazole-4-carboxamide isomerase [Kiritimatiellia bacterium]